MKMGIQKALETEGIKGKVEVKDLSSIRGEDADLIFASEEIAEKIDHPAEVIKVKNVTDKEAIRKKVVEVIERREN